MRSKYSTLASSFLLTATVLASSLCAQTAGPSSSPRPKVGYIRFWDMLPPANGVFILRKPSADPNGTALSARAYQYSGYVEFPAGRTRLAVYKDSEPKTAIQTIDIDLKPETFFTVLVAPHATGSGGVEVIDDTIAPDAPPGTLTIRNFFPGLTVSVEAASQKIADALAYGTSRVATSLGTSNLALKLHTKLPDGTPAESGAEVDFVHARRATVLIIPDSYGRFRPRTVFDGKLDE